MSGFTPYWILAFLGSLIFSMLLLHYEFWPFWGSSLAFDLRQCQEPWRQWELPRNEEQKKTKTTTQDRQKEINKERHWGRDKKYSPCFVVKTSPACFCLGGFRCLCFFLLFLLLFLFLLFCFFSVLCPAFVAAFRLPTVLLLLHVSSICCFCLSCCFRCCFCCF